MLNLKVHNIEEVSRCYDKLSKRKGKPTALKDVPSGSIIRFVGESQLTLFEIAEGKDHCSLFPAHAQLFGYACIGQGGSLSKNAQVEVNLIAKPEEIVRPETEPALLTRVTRTPDGLCHCQNYIYHMSGQHFVTDTVPEDRPTEVQDGACNCGLVLGQCREYDGRVWQKEGVA